MQCTVNGFSCIRSLTALISIFTSVSFLPTNHTTDLSPQMQSDDVNLLDEG